MVGGILLSKFIDFKGMGPSSWENIVKYLPLGMFFSLIFAVWATIRYGGKDKDKE
jgi:hypothetical protein